MNDTIKIPKFRTARRLIQWVERNWTRLVQEGKPTRLPPDRERVFLTTKKEEPGVVAGCIARYARWSGRIDGEYENVLRPFHDHLFDYMRNIHHREESADHLVDELAGDSRNLYRWSKVTDSRLPKHLEDTISDPRYAFLYSKEVLLGRLPAHLEEVFFAEEECYYAAKYAFEVIRGFASVRLPDALHTMMVMKSYQDPENENVKAYVKAAENDPNRVGNSTDKV